MMFKQLNRIYLLIGYLLIAIILVWQLTRWVYDDALEKLAATSNARLTLYTGTLREALSRYAFLPYVLAQNPEVQKLLSENKGVHEVNLYLENLTREAEAEAFFVMDKKGDTLASSNWRDKLSYIGENYRFRPYFIDTQKGQPGRFFAIGATTGRPGYFFSHPVIVEGKNAGAAIVKVDLTPLQADWHSGGETVLITDSNSVIFLSSSADWNYQTLKPLSHEQLDRIHAGRQYGHQDLSQIPIKIQEVLADNKRVIYLNKARYLMMSQSLPGLDGDIHHLISLTPVMKQVDLIAVNGMAMVLLFLAIILYIRERQHKQVSLRKTREAEAFRKMNILLQEKIVQHNRTEKILRETQDELIQAGKLTALGHMAAGIVHELNQPIATIRTYVASCRLLIERGNSEKLTEILGAIKKTTEHMASITAQLKSFAHKAPQDLEPIIVQEALKEVLAMTKALLKSNSISLTTRVSDKPMAVCCHQGRIKQVLLNLIRNSVDAMLEVEQRILQINVTDRIREVEITVADTGAGIAEHIAKELFTPFVTTKAVGDGLGIGLSICNRIVADIGGTISAENRTSGGAVFIVTLPLSEAEEEEINE